MGLPQRDNRYLGQLSFNQQKLLRRAAQIMHHEADAIRQTSDRLNEDFIEAVDTILSMSGSLIVTGIGKAGHIGQKLAATFSSTGTPAHFVHPAEAIHGDLGRFSANDVVLVLSNSGETDEITRILPTIASNTSCIIAITSNSNSTLTKHATHTLLIRHDIEACRLNLAPTSSTAAMLAYGDALAMVVSEQRQFTENDFAKFHPGGSLGVKLLTVNDAMRPFEECRIASINATVRDVFTQQIMPGRRSGAIMLVDQDEVLKGIFTDSDLARMLERRDEASFDVPIAEVMTTRFTAIHAGAKLQDAIDILATRKISELPVIDVNDHPIGMIDITDVVGLVAQATSKLDSPSQSEHLDATNLPITIRVFA
jgi:arabinose-5-phosphate isomerase